MKKMVFTNNWLYQYILLIILLLSGFATVGYAASVPNVFTSGSVAKSSEVNENFNYLADRAWEFNGNDTYYNKGNVGIGSTNPNYRLHLKGIFTNGVDYTLGLQAQQSSDAVALHLLNSTGERKCTLALAGKAGHAGDDTIAGDIAIRVSGGNDLHFVMDPDYLANFNAVTRFIIKHDGNVGIGTTCPKKKLHIAGYSTAEPDYNRPNKIVIENLNISGDNGAAIGFEGRNAEYVLATDSNWDGSNNFYLWDGTSETFRMLIDSNGNVGIGTESPSYTLDVNGTIRGNNVSPSDVRLKENIRTIDSALDKVAHLRGVYFHWKDSEEEKPQDMGLIAQEVEATFPEVVSEDQEGYKSISYGKLVGALVEAVKELKVQNEYLHARIKALESKL